MGAMQFQKNKREGFYLEVYYVLSLNKDEETYKKFIISQTADRCDYNFMKNIRKRLGL